MALPQGPEGQRRFFRTSNHRKHLGRLAGGVTPVGPGEAGLRGQEGRDEGRPVPGGARASTSFPAVSFPARAAPARWRGRPGHGALRPGGRGAPEIAARCRTCLMCPEIDCEHSKQWCDMIILTVCG